MMALPLIVGGGITLGVAIVSADRRDGPGWLGIPIGMSTVLAALLLIRTLIAVWIVGMGLGWWPPGLGD